MDIEILKTDIRLISVRILLVFYTGLLSFDITTAQDPPTVREIDQFEYGETVIGVSFYDPSEWVPYENPDIDWNSDRVSDEEKLGRWVAYLHSSPLYVFTVNDSNMVPLELLYIFGDTSVQMSARYWRIASLNPESADSVSVFSDYDIVWVKGEQLRSLSGSLFEDMSLLADKENLVGNGIKFFSKYFRVTPYKEVKDAAIAFLKSREDNTE